MLKIRSLVNAELIAEKNGVESTVQYGSGTYFEATEVSTYLGNDNEVLADISLADGSKLIGVIWNEKTFENHGVPETRVQVKVSEGLTFEPLRETRKDKIDFVGNKENQNEDKHGIRENTPGSGN